MCTRTISALLAILALTFSCSEEAPEAPTPAPDDTQPATIEVVENLEETVTPPLLTIEEIQTETAKELDATYFGEISDPVETWMIEEFLRNTKTITHLRNDLIAYSVKHRDIDFDSFKLLTENVYYYCNKRTPQSTVNAELALVHVLLERENLNEEVITEFLDLLAKNYTLYNMEWECYSPDMVLELAKSRKLETKALHFRLLRETNFSDETVEGKEHHRKVVLELAKSLFHISHNDIVIEEALEFSKVALGEAGISPLKFFLRDSKSNISYTASDLTEALRMNNTHRLDNLEAADCIVETFCTLTEASVEEVDAFLAECKGGDITRVIKAFEAKLPDLLSPSTFILIVEGHDFPGQDYTLWQITKKFLTLKPNLSEIRDFMAPFKGQELNDIVEIVASSGVVHSTAGVMLLISTLHNNEIRERDRISGDPEWHFADSQKIAILAIRDLLMEHPQGDSLRALLTW